MLISLRTAFTGVGMILAAFRVSASAPASSSCLPPSFACTSLSQISGNYAICSGDNSTDLSVETDSDSIDLEFVFFDTPQSGTNMYNGGALLGKVEAGQFAGAGPFVATLNNAVFPSVAVTDTFYVYARLLVSDPDLNDPTCRPYVEIRIIVHPLPLANAGNDVAICPGGSTLLSASGGTNCQWAPATGLGDPNNCSTTAAPALTTGYFVTVTNAFGCTATDGVIVSIHEPVGVVCNDNLYLSIGPNGSSLITPDMILEGVDDGLDVYSVAIFTLTGQPVNNPLACAQVGQTLKVKVTDTCNGSFCWSTIHIEDKIPPVIPCTDLTVTCAVENFSPGYLADSLGIAAGRPAASDNCILNSLTFVDSWQTVACGDSINGKQDIAAYLIREWTAKDAYNNMSTCLQYIYLQRRHIDALVLPQDTVVGCDNPLTGPANTGAPYFSDYGRHFSLYPNNSSCDISIAYTDEIIPVCAGTYKIHRSWTIVDWCYPGGIFTPGINPIYHSQIIKVSDEQGPVFGCPADLTVSTEPFNCCAIADLPDVVLSDNCSGLKNIEARVTAYDQYIGNPIGTYIVNGTLGDFPGNNYWVPDTLGVLGLTTCLPQGVHLVTYIATDGCDNSATCAFQLTVADITPPLAACETHTQVALGADGMALIDASTFDDGSYDNCTDVHFKVRRMAANDCQPNDTLYDQVKFCCSDIGDTVTVVFRVYDSPPPPGGIPLDFDLQNFNECMVQVLVEDKIKPSCIAPDNVTVSCESFDPTLETYGFAMSTDNCCLDTITESLNYNLFDTVCNRGTIVRTFRAKDCAGLVNPCIQRIYVEYKQDYWIKFPDDKIVQVCDGSANFGEPIFFGENCELLGVSYEDVIYTVVTDACYKIERTWNIINWCTYDPNKPCIFVPNPDIALERPFILPGPIVSQPGTQGPWSSTVIKVLPTDPEPTDYSIFWNPDANCYQYKQIIIVEDTKDPVIADCPATKPEFCDLTNNDPQLWNESNWLDPVTNSHDLCEGPVDLTITATDLCTGADLHFRYLLLLDLDNDGVTETVINSNDPQPGGIVLFNNANTPNFSGGTPRLFDARVVPADQKWRFSLQTTQTGMNVNAVVRWNTLANPAQFAAPELPYGTHRIKWIVEDGCGNEAFCEYPFTVKDCKAPTVVCFNGLSVNIMPTQMVQLWATDFLQYAQDNCTPPTATINGPNLLKFGVRKAGAGTGFPVDAAGNPVTNVVFSCAELGMQTVELWAQDLAGNADYCQTFVEVGDNNNNCVPGGMTTVAGTLKTELQDGVEDAVVHVQSGAFSGFDLTDDQGQFLLPNAVPFAADYILTPVKEDNPLNGVSTFDLVLISKHILGLQPLTDPYKMIAADANKSNSITTFDIVELRKLILGIYPELPNNSSWRFVDKSYVFPQPLNPFGATFPETISNNSLLGQPNDFVAVKVGDVNDTAIPNGLMNATDRAAGTLLFDVQDRAVQAGENVEVTFTAATPVLGFQFTLNLDGLEVTDIVESSQVKRSNFGVFNDALTVSIDGAQAFTVRFHATRTGNLSDMMRVSGRVTKAEAYAANGSDFKTYATALRFESPGGQVVAGAGFELYQNQPNPFTTRTMIGFYLPEASGVVLTVYDATGNALWSASGRYEKGYHTEMLNSAWLNASGDVLFYSVESVFGKVTKRMSRAR